MIRATFVKVLTVCLIGVGICIWGFSHSSALNLERGKPIHATYESRIDKIRQQLAEKMREEFDLVYSGHRGIVPTDEEADIQFDTHRKATVEEARALYLHVTQEFVKMINEDDQREPFLQIRPFTEKQTFVSISFGSFEELILDNQVSLIQNIFEENGMHISYYTNDPFAHRYMKFYDEPYPEALQRAESFPKQNLAVHQNTPCESALDETIAQFVKEMKKSHHYECWSVGGKANQNLEEISIYFVVLERATQEEARTAVLIATKRLLQLINTDEKLKPYLGESPFPSGRLKLRISFRKNNYCSYSDGSMESVAIQNDKVAYFQELPPGLDIYPLETPLFAEESYQEALDFRHSIRV